MNVPDTFADHTFADRDTFADRHLRGPTFADRHLRGPLLTLDTGDFGPLMESGSYGLPVMTPGAFLERQKPAEGTASGGATG